MRHRRGRWLFLTVLLAGVAAFGGVWYAASQRARGSEPAFGGLYVEGIAGAPARINPIFAAQNEADDALSALIFAGLTRLDEHGNAFPDLAEEWSVSADGRLYTFRLRQGLIWQDGAPLTADDVLFTYSLLRDPELRSPPPLSRVLTQATITQVDALTFTIELAQPFAPLPAYLTLGILPAHRLESISAAALFDAEFNQQPIGAGPYRLESLTPERALLVANPAYHFGQPFIQRLELRFYRDERALYGALRDRQISGALFRAPLAAADLLALQQRRDLRQTLLPTGEVTFVYLNLRRPLFEDRRVRQALLYALDRAVLVEQVLADHGLPADSPLPPQSWAHTAALDRYDPDAEIAGLLLDEAGWRLDGAGIRSKGGRELGFTLACTSDPTQVALAQAIAERWAAIGVRVTVAPTGATTLVRDVLEPRNYDAALFVQPAAPDPDPFPAWHSTQASGKAGNISSLSDPRFDRLLEQARLQPATAGRKGLYSQFQELFAQEVPAIPLYGSAALYVQGASLRGVRLGLTTTAGARFWQVQEWHLKTQ